MKKKKNQNRELHPLLIRANRSPNLPADRRSWARECRRREEVGQNSQSIEQTHRAITLLGFSLNPTRHRPPWNWNQNSSPPVASLSSQLTGKTLFPYLLGFLDGNKGRCPSFSGTSIGKRITVGSAAPIPSFLHPHSIEPLLWEPLSFPLSLVYRIVAGYWAEPNRKN